MAWTQDRVDLLKKLWADGLTASQIAAELGGFPGTADGGRSAVIGKVHRLGLSGRSKSHAPAKQRAPRVRRAALKPQTSMPITNDQQATAAAHFEEAEARADLPAPGERRLTLLQLDSNTCRWPHGNPSTEEFYFCGAVSIDTLPYCSYHCRIAYPFQPAQARRSA